MRLALSTALLVIDGRPPPEAVVGLIEGFHALDLPVLHIGSDAGRAFTGSGLEALLEERGILTLVVCGGPAEAVVRDAGNLGFRVFEAGDGAAMAEVAAALDVLRRRA
jgi:nicotinamidase-related amidase